MNLEPDNLSYHLKLIPKSEIYLVLLFIHAKAMKSVIPAINMRADFLSPVLMVVQVNFSMDKVAFPLEIPGIKNLRLDPIIVPTGIYQKSKKVFQFRYLPGISLGDIRSWIYLAVTIRGMEKLFIIIRYYILNKLC